jgi:hypothetical protein
VDIILDFQILQAFALDLGNSGKKLPPPVPKVWFLLPLRSIPQGSLELRPNNSCMLLFCSAALQLRRADSTGSVIRILEEQAWNGAKSTIF